MIEVTFVSVIAEATSSGALEQPSSAKMKANRLYGSPTP